MSTFYYATVMHLFCKLSRNVLEMVNLLCLLGINDFSIFYAVFYNQRNRYKIHKNVPLLLIVLYRVQKKVLHGDHVHLPVLLSISTFFAT